MAHPEQYDFVNSVKDKFSDLFVEQKVLEVGSLNINGSVRSLFTDCAYTGIDLEEGPGVDLVMQGQHADFPDNTFDVSISAECFEHNPYWLETFLNMIRMTSKLVIFTCATEGRPEHGTTRTDTYSSPFTSKTWDYYRNLTEQDFTSVVPFALIFKKYEFSTNPHSHDLYFWGLLK